MDHTLLLERFLLGDFLWWLKLKGSFQIKFRVQGYKLAIETQVYIIPFISILCFQSELHWRKGIPSFLPADVFSENYEVIPI